MSWTRSLPVARSAALALLIALLSPGARAAEPEAGKSRSPFAGNARLEQRVTLESAKIPLSEALAEVTRQTGVKLVALERAADEPVALYVKEQPAAEVLRQLAELLGYWWSKRGPADDVRYEIYQDLRSKNEEAAILGGARRAVLATLQSELGRHRRYAGLPAEELKKRVDAGNAAMAQMMRQGGGAGFGAPGQHSEGIHEWQAARNVSQPLGRLLLGVLERLTPAQWQTLLAGDPITYSSEPKRGELRLAPEMVASLKNTTPISPLPIGVAEALGGDAQQQLRRLEERTAEEWTGASGYRIDIQLVLSMGSSPVGMLRVGPQPLNATPGLSVLNGLNIMAMPDLRPPGPRETPEARKARLAADPVLAKKGRLAPSEPAAPPVVPFLQRTGDLMRRIAAGYQVQFVADAYTSGSFSFGGMPTGAGAAAPGAAGEGEPLYELLDRSFGLMRDWTRDGDFIRLRSRTWAFDRSTEIPSRLMRQWAEAWQARDGWDLDQLAAIVDRLRPEQIMTFELAAQEYGIPSGGQLFMLLMSADALRLYHRLFPAQRQALMAGRPLALGSLTPAQQPYALDMARGRGRSIIQMFMGPPPWRSPRDLAQAVLTLKGRPAPAMGSGAPVSARPATVPGVSVRAAPSGPSAGPAPSAPAAPPRMMAIFELRYPEGRPETFPVPGVLPPGTPLPAPAASPEERR